MRKLIALVMTIGTLALPTANMAQDLVMPTPDANNATPSSQPAIIPNAPSIDATAYVLMDAKTGTVIAEKNADQSIPPASLTKLMSLYIVFGAIENDTITLDDKVRISEAAWKTGGSKMFVKVGDQVPVSELVQGVIVDSGNDATIALSEYVAGSEQSFVEMMNLQAKRLGMNSTHFEDADGLPSNEHYTTASDLAILTRALINHFPQYYHYFSEKWFTYAGIRQPNRNRLLWRYENADGLKTGHTEDAGYCLISSALQPSDNMRLITVVLGAPSDEERSSDSIKLLTYGFRFFETTMLYDANTPVSSTRVWKGKEKEINLGLTQPLFVTIPTGSQKFITTSVKLNEHIQAPVKEGKQYGMLSLILQDEVVAQEPLIALENDPKGGLFRSIADTVSGWFHHKDKSQTNEVKKKSKAKKHKKNKDSADAVDESQADQEDAINNQES
jgi:serine-type D-Ala-D-Ala carboxypeptidase (penicillin-binding protein 5/6)